MFVGKVSVILMTAQGRTTIHDVYNDRALADAEVARLMKPVSDWEDNDGFGRYYINEFLVKGAEVEN